MQMDLRKAELALRSSYGEQVAQYRRDDEIEITTPHHLRLAGSLAEISSSFGRPISVLDVGCGTGRYFYCLRNVERLIGMDITPGMLSAARQPVKSEEISAQTIELRCGNVFFVDFAPQSFDFIYSFGMFGHGCPLTVEVCDKFHTWLAPGGRLFFDVVDFAGLRWTARMKKRIRKLVYAALPARLKAAMDRRERDTPFAGATKGEVERILRASRFSEFEVTSHVCDSPLWRGRHLEIRAATRAHTLPVTPHVAPAESMELKSALP